MLALAVLASTATVAQANFVVDGNFSAPPITGTIPYTSGTTFGGAWTVTPGGSVDLLSSSFIVAPGGPGSQSVDLDGTNPGGATAAGISQTVSLTSGSQYLLTFSYTDNYQALTSPSATVSVGSLSTTISSPTGNNPFTTVSYVFTATSASQVLSFLSKDASTDQSGIIIANVSINTVPEPASCAMLGLGIAAVGAFARARRRTA
jgi:hypothetical protein